MGEGVGVPSVAILTDRFADAGELMSRALGAEGYPFVVIEHPISSAGRRELETRAAAAALACKRRLVKS